MPEQDGIHVKDGEDSWIPEQVAGVKRPFYETQSSDELNINPRKSISPSQRPETRWSENITREAQYRENSGSIQRIVAHFEVNPGAKFSLKDNLIPKNTKSTVYSFHWSQKSHSPILWQGQYRNQLKFIRGPRPMNVDSEPSKRDAQIDVIDTEPRPSKHVRRQLRKERTMAKMAASQDPVACVTATSQVISSETPPS
jgi:hypothetical protein